MDAASPSDTDTQNLRHCGDPSRISPACDGHTDTMAGDPTFTVDTKLFRELGELLVGRESTALVELIKNAYDADATQVRIFGEHLSDSKHGVIVVEDNGIGMSADEFARGFLRIAGRTKLEKDRRSPSFKRRFTGEKGVGRLAAHKLATALVIESMRWDGTTEWDELRGFKAQAGVTAKIDWDEVEKRETLDKVAGSGAVTVTERTAQGSWVRSGTKLRLSPLRRTWKRTDIDRFHNEVATLIPPPPLTDDLPSQAAPKALLFERPRLRDESSKNSFDVVFAGELSTGDRALPTRGESADWIIELRCDGKRLMIAVEPSVRFKKEHPAAEGFRGSRSVADEARGLQYDARIFERHTQPWEKALQGIRIYHEGFRVLPYGDPSDDWLNLNRDAKSRRLALLSNLETSGLRGLTEGEIQEGYAVKGSSMYLGAVFLTRERSQGLQLLVNREGFLPGPAFDALRDSVRLAIDVCTRLRHLATASQKEQKRDPTRQRRAAEAASLREAPSSFIASEVAAKIQKSVADALDAAKSDDAKGAAHKLQDVTLHLNEAARLVKDAATEAAMYRVLASLGLEQGAFLHEVNSLALTADHIAQALEKLAAEVADRTVRSRLKNTAGDARDLRERLRRNAAYITDVTGVGGRKRRSRQDLLERFNVVSAFFSDAAKKRGVSIEPEIPPNLRTPAMFPAEVTALFSNLISNAIKFAGHDGRVHVKAAEDGPELAILVENTGEQVDLATSEKWFLPFQSTTLDVDEALGQGMGLGLTITRSLVDEYGGSIRFVKPRPKYATAVEVRIPTK